MTSQEIPKSFIDIQNEELQKLANDTGNETHKRESNRQQQQQQHRQPDTTKPQQQRPKQNPQSGRQTILKNSK